MNSIEQRRAFRRDLLLAGLMIITGFAVAAASLQLATAEHPKMAQATQPLQSTPGAENKPSAPDEPSTTGTGSRPLEVAPQPARPDADAQQTGAQPALPPAPAEKTGEPIRPKS
jgi:hypothetical protein